MQKFEPDQLVLVRYFEGAPWRLRRYSMPYKKGKAHETQDGMVFVDACIIPYSGNEHLLGTTDAYRAGEGEGLDGQRHHQLLQRLQEVNMEELIKIEVVNGKPCVTSLQVAEAFGKRHDNVLRDIEQTISQLPEIFVKLNFEEYEYPFDTGIGMRMMKAYLLTKDAFTLLTMGYTGEKAMTFKVAYINRFNEMERQLAETEKGLLPQTYPEALRALAAEVELKEAEKQQRLLAEHQRDEAIRTKAQIGSRREATSMATASAAVRQRDALADRMGEGRNWKTVRAIPWLLTIFTQSNPMYSQVGKKLTALSGRMGYAVHTVEDSRFGMVKSYHVDVIGAFKIELDKDPAMLGKYRRAA